MSEIDRAAAYIRVSTQKQADEGSHERQRELIEEWAEENDVDQVDYYEDLALSGQALDRLEYEKMMDNIDQYDALVVRELSRFSRSMKQMLDDIWTIKGEGCEFISIRENFDTDTPQGKLLLNMKGAFNQFQSDLASERTRRMIERRKEQGKPVGRPKKLSDAQIKALKREKEKHNYSHSTLAALAKERFDEEVSRSTIQNYMQEYD